MAIATRTWEVAPPGFRLGVHDWSNGQCFVFSHEMVGSWANPADPTDWSVLVAIDGFVVEITAAEYTGAAQRRACMIPPGAEDPSVTDGGA
jgi:hypothetical protein